MRTICCAVLLAGCGAAVPTAALAQSSDDELARPPQFEQLVQCRTVTSAEERLSCYDKYATQLERAAEANEIVIADRQTVREAKRGLFGLGLPQIKLFGNDEEKITEIEGAVRDARMINKKWIVTLDGGGTWQQIDTRSLSRYPRQGMKVKIREAALGSYFANFDGQRAIRVRRVE